MCSSRATRIAEVGPDSPPRAPRSSTPTATSSSRASSTPIGTRGRRRSGPARRTTPSSPTSARSSTSSRPKYRPDDVYAANRWGALECLNAGITTLVDWSHIMNTPDHADAAVQGLKDTGIRSVFAFGFPNTSIQAWWFGLDWGGSVERIDGDRRAPRPDAVPESDDSGLITMALATRGTNFCKPDVVRYEWELAKELGINITVHVAMDRFGYTKGQLQRPQGHGPALPEHDVHPLVAPDRRGVADGRATRAATSRSPRRSSSRWATAGRRPEGRQAGHPGRALLRRRDDGLIGPVHPDARDLRVRAGRRHQAAWDEDLDGNEPTPDLITSARSSAGRRSTGRRWPGSPTGPAPSRRARRPTS